MVKDVLQFKKLSSSDIVRFRELLNVFAEAFNEHDMYMSQQPSDKYLSHLLQKDHFITLVAMSENKIIGGLVAYVLEKFEQERSEVYIYDIAVLDDYRRQGVATQLIQSLREIVKEKKAWVIFIQADKGDIPAIKLYESLGKREDVCHFDIKV